MARDDPVSLDEDVPTDLILQNPNSLLIQSDHGIHCDFFTEEQKDSGKSVRRMYPDIVISYIDEVSKCNKSIKWAKYIHNMAWSANIISKIL